MSNITTENIIQALSNVVEPDLKKDIVTLNLVDQISIEGNKVSFRVKVSSPAMHSKKRMQEACEFAIERKFGKEVEVDCAIAVLEKEEQTPETRKVLPGVKHVVAIASGKGGVGKSTVASNIAVGLASRGFKVGLIDADIYGPSAPMMFDLMNEKPGTIDIDGGQFINPLESFGVKVLSIGFFADVSQAIVWRGPMASKALNQLFTDAHWGELDYMIVDLPPGTGDIHLTLVQNTPLSGAVVVSTPQEVALADAKKGVNMFQLPSVNVPVLGIVENMAFFTPPDMPDKKYHIFGQDGAKKLASNLDVAFLGELPIVQSIRESGDVGRPAVLQENTQVSEAFNEIIDNFVTAVSKAEKSPATV